MAHVAVGLVSYLAPSAAGASPPGSAGASTSVGAPASTGADSITALPQQSTGGLTATVVSYRALQR
jgi:hypothetical protein